MYIYIFFFHDLCTCLHYIKVLNYMQIVHIDIFGFWNKVCHKKEPNGLINGSKTDLVWDAKNQYTHPYLSLSMLHYFDFNILSVRAQIQNDFFLGGGGGGGEVKVGVGLRLNFREDWMFIYVIKKLYIHKN